MEGEVRGSSLSSLITALLRKTGFVSSLFWRSSIHDGEEESSLLDTSPRLSVRAHTPQRPECMSTVSSVCAAWSAYGRIS